MPRWMGPDAAALGGATSAASPPMFSAAMRALFRAMRSSRSRSNAVSSSSTAAGLGSGFAGRVFASSASGVGTPAEARRAARVVLAAGVDFSAAAGASSFSAGALFADARGVDSTFTSATETRC